MSSRPALSSQLNSVIIAGATGLVGDEILHQLLGDPSIGQIHAVTRRPLPITSEKLVNHLSPDLTVTNWRPEWQVPQQGYIALGTTLAQAGSKEALAKVDLELVTKV